MIDTKGPLLIGALALSVGLTAVAWTQAARPALSSLGAEADLQLVLSWLPADTETVIAANGPFLIPIEPSKQDPVKDMELSTQQIAEKLQMLPLGLLETNNGLLARQLAGRRVALALEGSRHFRAPANLGEMPFEGCAIVVLGDDLEASADSFFRSSKPTALRTEQIEGQRVAVFQEKLESDTWTTFVAFPNPRVVLAASDRDYLRDVLARLQGKKGERALPESLPEWGRISTRTGIWGLRHYDKTQSAKDPSSPFGGRKSANFPDEKAVGVAFEFDLDKRSATVTYMGDNSVLGRINTVFASAGTEKSARDLHIQSRDLGPSAVSSSYQLLHSDSVSLFLFVLGGVLGHAIYL